MAAACTSLVNSGLSYGASLMTDLMPVFAIVVGLAIVGALGSMVIGWFRG